MAAAATRPRHQGGRIRRACAIDEKTAFIKIVQTTPGRLAMALIACAAIATFFPWWESVFVTVAAMAAALLPHWRTRLIFLATWTAAVLEIVLGENDVLNNVALVMAQEPAVTVNPTLLACTFLLLVLAGSALVLRQVRAQPKSLLARRPMMTLLALEAVLCGLLSLDLLSGTARVVLWSLVFVMTPYIWFLPFAIVDHRSQKPGAALGQLDQLGLLRPFWSPTYLPFGKGGAFLRKFLSATPHDLAVTQLKAIKLLLWANLLLLLRTGMDWAFREQWQIPQIDVAIDAFLRQEAFPVGVSWVALVVSTARFALQIAFWAHLFIGIARLAGYRLPRGSWRPLESRTLMDYFNRFHYYFKELLVDFFFMPTFLSTFRKHPRLRMFFATFMAAGVGNALWHFIRDIHLVATLGLAQALATYASYAFYCVILATGIGVSQVRASIGVRPPDTLAGRLMSFTFVWSFVVCLHVFSDGSRSHSLGERLSFFASLFGVNSWI